VHNVAARQPCGTVSLLLCRRAVRYDETAMRDCLKTGFHPDAIMVATASTEHSYWLALAFVETQAPANRNAQSKQWQP